MRKAAEQRNCSAAKRGQTVKNEPHVYFSMRGEYLQGEF